jgi:hypothetical protein
MKSRSALIRRHAFVSAGPGMESKKLVAPPSVIDGAIW